uniref:BPTI/Kunitz inhibitor domain-containing protein n=1 Tax=Heterorhabditis bacteriophora TaxID=37862 RepID=A0A1I7XUF4_HETBA
MNENTRITKTRPSQVLTECQYVTRFLNFEFVANSNSELDCYLPLHIGHGKNDANCIQHADYRFYYDTNNGQCLTFWYLGCGGNANNFYTYEVCQRTCKGEKLRAERIPRQSTHVCFHPPADRGSCIGNSSSSLQRWTYTSQQRCDKFMYTGCGGNENRCVEIF